MLRAASPQDRRSHFWDPGAREADSRAWDSVFADCRPRREKAPASIAAIRPPVLACPFSNGLPRVRESE
jgi:hypothetical protein